MAALSPSTRLGQYEIVELLGEGGMASVYRAWQPSLRRYVALKVLAPSLGQDAEFIQRFQREAIAAANLKHPNIVTVYDVGTENGQYFIAMELIEGGSLATRLQQGEVFPPERVADVIGQVGAALDYAHQRGFIHRDIKPGNIVIDVSGRVVLTDFGIAKAVTGSGMTASLTRAGTIFGTPHYMSPEQVKEEPLDYRTDLYSLAIVCFEMLTGHVPFEGTTTHAILYAQAQTPPPPLRSINPAMVPAVEAVVNKALAKSPNDRFQSGAAFARALAEAARGQWPAGVTPPVGVRVPTGPGRPVTPGAGRPIPPVQGVQEGAPDRGRSKRGLWIGLGVAGLVPVLCIAAVLTAWIVANGKIPDLQAEATSAPTASPLPAASPTSTATELPPTVVPEPPRRAQIAFVSKRDGNAEIYLMGTDGSRQTNLTNSPASEYWPQWSPDGTQITYHAYEPGQSVAHIYLMGTGGEDRIQLTEGDTSNKFPSWSPDGTSIVFVSDRSGNYEIYVMSREGAQIVQLTDDPAQDYFPMWSPDGTQIVFDSDRSGNTEIYIMNADGSAPVNLTNNPATDTQASWSPDGTRIAFSSDRSGQMEIWVMNGDGQEAIQLTTQGGREPRWSDDGAYIVFYSERDGNSEVYVMNSDGRVQTRLTNSTDVDFDPCWSR